MRKSPAKYQQVGDFLAHIKKSPYLCSGFERRPSSKKVSFICRDSIRLIKTNNYEANHPKTHQSYRVGIDCGAYGAWHSHRTEFL